MIDPREPDLVLKTVERCDGVLFSVVGGFFSDAAPHREGINVTTVVSTNHQDDGANAKLVEAFPGLRVVGFDERIAGLTHQLKHGELFDVGQQRVRGLFTPCHTAGSAVFHVLSARRPGFGKSPNRNPHSILFSGDTLLVGGCGQFLEGSERDMYNNLIHVIAALPADTDLYCGHEHTVQNLEFAHALLGGQDADVNDALDRARRTRSAFTPTVPGILEDEFLFNPFMRANHMAVMRAAGCGPDKSPQEVMRRLREKANQFERAGGAQ